MSTKIQQNAGREQHLQDALRWTVRSGRLDNAGAHGEAQESRRRAFASLQHYLLMDDATPAPSFWVLNRLVSGAIASDAAERAA